MPWCFENCFIRIGVWLSGRAVLRIEEVLGVIPRTTKTTQVEKSYRNHQNNPESGCSVYKVSTPKREP